MEDKNAYDIDKFCQEQAVVYPGRFLSKEDIDVLKDDAFREGLSLASYMRVVSVLCRNKFMKEHNIEFPNINEANGNGVRNWYG